jgi:chromosome segregation ATPase
MVSSLEEELEALRNDREENLHYFKEELSRKEQQINAYHDEKLELEGAISELREELDQSQQGYHDLNTQNNKKQLEIRKLRDEITRLHII